MSNVRIEAFHDGEERVYSLDTLSVEILTGTSNDWFITIPSHTRMLHVICEMLWQMGYAVNVRDQGAHYGIDASHVQFDRK